MSVPSHLENGLLPDGEYEVTWGEFRERFGWNPRRVDLADHTEDLLRMVSAAGGNQAYVFGSYITMKPNPGDVDILYAIRGVQPRLLPDLFRDPTLIKTTFEVDLIAVDDDQHSTAFPEPTIHFARSDRSGVAAGIITLSLSTLPQIPRSP